MTTNASSIAAGRLFRQTALETIEHLFERCERRRLPAGETLLAPDVANDTCSSSSPANCASISAAATCPSTPCSASAIASAKCRCSTARSHRPTSSPRSTPPCWRSRTNRSGRMIDSSHGLARNLLAILAGRVRHDNLTLVTTQSRSLEFEEAASVDALTGLHNRRWMNDAFPRALRRCERDAAPLCLIMADIDIFKRLQRPPRPPGRRFGTAHRRPHHCRKPAAAGPGGALRRRGIRRSCCPWPASTRA